MHARHLQRRHVGGRRLARGRQIDRARRNARAPLAGRAMKSQLAALGVEGAGDDGGAADAFGERHGENAARDRASAAIASTADRRKLRRPAFSSGRAMKSPGDRPPSAPRRRAVAPAPRSTR